MLKNANINLLLLSICTTFLLTLAGVPKSAVKLPKGLPSLALSEIQELETVRYSNGQELLIPYPEGGYSPQLFSLEDPEKLVNLESLVKAAKAVVKLKAEVSADESSEDIKVLRNLKKYKKKPENSAFFSIDNSGKLSTGIGDSKKSTPLVVLSPQYFEDISLFKTLSRAKKLAKISKSKLKIDTKALAALELESIYLAFHPSTKKAKEQTAALKLHPRVTELILQRPESEDSEARRGGARPKPSSNSSPKSSSSSSQSSSSSSSAPNNNTFCAYEEVGGQLTAYCKAAPYDPNWQGPPVCSTHDDCVIKDCTPEGTCELFEGLGPDKCKGPEDCRHKACDPVLDTCAVVLSPGIDQCQADSDCSHYACDNDGACSLAKGASPDPSKDCKSMSDCSHKACNQYGECSRVVGKGENSCESNAECGHKACNAEGTCEQTPGVGEDECSPYDSSNDCYHQACVDSVCTNVPGEGEDSCDRYDVNNNCSHLACSDNGTCDEMPGEGENSCGSGPEDDCQHLECTEPGGECVPYAGEGSDDCSACQPPSSESESSSSSQSYGSQGQYSSGTSYGSRLSDGGEYRGSPDIVKLERRRVLPTVAAQTATTQNPLQTTITTPLKVEFFQDIKCGMCKGGFLNGLVPLLKNNSGNKNVSIEIREFPLIPSQQATTLANASKCSHEQLKQFEFLTVVYTNMKVVNAENYLQYAKDAGLKTEELQACVNSRKYDAEIAKDVEQGKQLGIRGTPSYLINGRLHVGMLTYDSLLIKSLEQ